jgi:hypothetical protein
MRIAIGVRTAGLWATLAGAALVAACNGGAAAPTGGVTNVTLSWAAPTENTDGSPVGFLGGYRVYYGTASQQYTTTIDVANPGLTTYVIDNLEIGVTYYFALTAVSGAGVESALSSELAVTIS